MPAYEYVSAYSHGLSFAAINSTIETRLPRSRKGVWNIARGYEARVIVVRLERFALR